MYRKESSLTYAIYPLPLIGVNHCFKRKAQGNLKMLFNLRNDGNIFLTKHQQWGYPLGWEAGELEVKFLEWFSMILVVAQMDFLKY